MAQEIINKAKINKKLLQDVKNTVGSIYRMNAPGAIGYVFNESANGNSIARGMYFDRGDDKSEWDYYLDFKTGILSKSSLGSNKYDKELLGGFKVKKTKSKRK